jgi:hypothetical protein
MLGIAKDNSDLLRRAINYLEGKNNET